MRQFPNVEWHLIPGNHDAHNANSPWERLLLQSLPTNIVIHTSPEPHAVLEGSAWILPSILTQRHMSSDPTAAMDSMVTPVGALRIGLAHGSVYSFGSSEQSTNNLLAVDRAETARLDYFALGDWHGVRQINDRTWYSGTPEPDGFNLGTAGGGQVLLVDLIPGSLPVVTPLASGKFLWRNETVIVRIRELDKLLRKTEAVLQAQATNIKLTLLPSAVDLVRLDGGPISTNSVSLIEDSVLSVEGIGEILIKPGVQNRETLLTRQIEENRQLRQALQAFSCDSLDVAEELFTERRKCENELAQARQELTSQTPADTAYKMEAGAEALRNQVSILENRLATEMQAAGLKSLPDLTGAEDAVREAERTERESSEAVALARAPIIIFHIQSVCAEVDDLMACCTQRVFQLGL
jgi:hypothetical protein